MCDIEELYIKRCFDLALLGRGTTSPNPLVGAVIVYDGRIIGEGYHMKYGSAHAEVNAVASVMAEDRKLLSKSTLYISLEPCCIQGNTPPCTDLIIRSEIPRIVFSTIDQTAGVKGQSIQILETAGRAVKVSIKESQGAKIVRPRTVFTTQKRPYIILKYAQSQDGFLGQPDQSVWLTNPISKRLVHKWRSESDAIFVGTNTARVDNPQLTNRLYFGASPKRLVLDRNLTLNPELHLLDQHQETLVITEQVAPRDQSKLRYLQLPFDQMLIPKILDQLYQEKCSSLIVEGGKQLLESFIELGYWDEARVFETSKYLYEGIKAPLLAQIPDESYTILDDRLYVYYQA